MKTFLGLLVRLGIFAAAVTVIALSVRYFSGPEDVWLCSGGQWVAHGSPSTPKPDGPCGGSQTKADQPADFANIDPTKILNQQGYLVENSDHSWGFVYMAKNTPPYELGSAVLQMEPRSTCFSITSNIGQPCVRTTWQPGAEAALIGELIKPGLARVLELRLIPPKEASAK
jgi:hypothetical protein